jgi:hypothetical protein
MRGRRTQPGKTMYLSISIARSICAAVLATLALLLPLKPAQASEYSDLWVTPGENAWGVNFVQWDSVIYATMYIYGSDKKPTWYGAVLNRDLSGNFSGTLYFTQGTYFANPWNPGDMLPEANTVAGTASFRPSTTNDYQGTLVYAVNGVGTVSKPLQRFNDHPAIPLAGKYYGAESGALSGCATVGTFTDKFPLQVVQTSNALTLVFAYEEANATCTMSGTLVQNGLLYSVPNAAYSCTGGINTTASMFNIKQTAQGIEGQYSAPNSFGGCQEDTRFSAVFD